jgi:hypothetical protein
MPLNDRITSVEKLRAWTDKIPFHYEYTAGVAGEKFLRGLQEGRILASECGKCGKLFMPPKMYCVDCYVETRRFREVGPGGEVLALAKSSVGFDGRRLARPKTFVFVGFKGVTGGLIHTASGEGLEIGSKVAPRFRPRPKREGSVLDIECFVKS